MKKWILIVAVLTVSGCETLKPRTVSSAEAGEASRLEFQSGPDSAAAAAKAAIAEQKWKLLYSGTERPKDDHGFQSNNHFSGETDDQLAWSKSDQAGLKPTAYLQAKTPTSAFSWGAELFVVVYATDTGGSTIAISASTSQALENDKLGSYIRQLGSAIDQRLD